MIDLSNETVLSLTEAARHLPTGRNGKQVHRATVFRWAQRGVRGVRLETIQIGGTKCTSFEALQRFCERLADSRPHALGNTPEALHRQRKRQKRRAEEECEAAGL